VFCTEFDFLSLKIVSELVRKAVFSPFEVERIPYFRCICMKVDEFVQK
jgi:hypothetical protein